jgi:hypothetical protein
VAERTVITELIQAGIESTYGTSAVATKKFASMGFDISPQADFTRVRPMGFKIDTIVALIREWSSGDIRGYPTYNELPYIFTSLLKKVTATTTTGVSTWVWDWSTSSVETVDSFTIEQGDAATRAHKITGGIVTGWNCSWTRTGDPNMGGTVMGQAFTDGITPTPALVAAVPFPILPNHIDVYADPLWANVGTTKLTRVMEAALKIDSMWDGLWVLNTTNTSYVAVVQQAPDITLELTVEADAAGMALLTQMRAGTAQAFQIKGTGPNIPAGTPTTPHSIKIDFMGAIEGPPELGDTDGVRTAKWTIRNTHDATSGKALRVTMINGVATL